HEPFRLLRSPTEEELLHLGDEELARLRIDWRQSIFVDQHRLMPEPALPAFFRDVLVDALAQFPGIRCVIEPLGLGSQHYTIHGTRHDKALLLLPDSLALQLERWGSGQFQQVEN